MEKFTVFLDFLYYFSGYRRMLHFGIKMCTVNSIELNTFQIDNRDLTTDNICEKNAQSFIMDDSLVRHPSFYVSFLDDSPVCHPPSKVLMYENLYPFIF